MNLTNLDAIMYPQKNIMRFHSLINTSFFNDFHQKCSATILKTLFNVFTTFAVVQSLETLCIHNVFMSKVITNRSCSHSQLDWQLLVVICSHSQSLVAWLSCLFITDPTFCSSPYTIHETLFWIGVKTIIREQMQITQVKRTVKDKQRMC